MIYKIDYKSSLAGLILAACILPSVGCLNLSEMTATPPASMRSTSSMVNCSASNDQQETTQANQPEETQVKVRNPIRIATFQDKTGSSLSTRTEQLGENDFLTPINLLRCTGGELAFGLINDQSNRPLLRLRIEVPPAKPTEPKGGNPFERAEREAAYENQLTEYEENLRIWESQTNKRVNTFMNALKPLLAQKANARTTSIWPAVARADLFLSEQDTDWPRPTHRYAVFNTDAIDTAHSTPVTMRSEAKMLLINGVASVGVLEPLAPLRFESAQSAFRFISATEPGDSQ